MTVPAADAQSRRSGGLGSWLRGQLRNIAPFMTLAVMVIFFSIASPSFLSVDNLWNVLTNISVAAIIAVGLTFVILCAEIDLSVAAVANATGIVLAYFTKQPDYVNIDNIPLPGGAAMLFAFFACLILGAVNAFTGGVKNPVIAKTAAKYQPWCCVNHGMRTLK